MRSTPYLLLLLILFSFIPAKLSAQNEQKHWFMGAYLGMRFDGQPSPTILYNNKMYAPYASAVMSDPQTGKFLFYTDGIKVWNANHQVMQNGTGLIPSAMCMEVIIVPVPGSSTNYYIFSSGQSGDLHYAEVDMTKDQGNGEVINKTNLLATDIESYFAVVKQEYENGYWLISHRRATNEFLAFRISKDEINKTPVVSAVGGSGAPPAHMWKTGQLVSSSNGKKIAQSQFHNSFVELFNFDKICGKVSYDQQLKLMGTSCGNANGIAFSPSDTFLYITYFCSTSAFNVLLTQYNIYAPNPSHMAITITQTSDALREMRLAPDGKIYIVTSESGAVTSKLDVIHNPDNFGNSCNYEKYAIRLHPGDISYFTEHLPNFIYDRSNYLNSPAKPEIKTAIGCAGETSNFKLEKAVTDLDSFIWEFGDGTFFTNYKPVNSVSKTYDKAGKYLVKYKWYRCGYEYSVEKEIYIDEKPEINIGNDTTLCAGTPFTLQGLINGAHYLWNTGETGTSITVTEPGTYSVIISRGNCSAADTITINHHPKIWIALGAEYFICEDENELVKLDVGKGFENYLWHPTGDTTQWIIVSKTGGYYVIVNDFLGCSGSDGTIVKRRCEANLIFPNVFSPNADGLNDEFKPVAKDVIQYSLKIYNRWGEKIFESNDVNKGWDGNYKGRKAPEGSYIWISDYTGETKKQAFQNFHKNGYFTLIR